MGDGNIPRAREEWKKNRGNSFLLPCRVIFVMGVLTGRQIRSALNTTWGWQGRGETRRRDEPCTSLPALAGTGDGRVLATGSAVLDRDPQPESLAPKSTGWKEEKCVSSISLG